MPISVSLDPKWIAAPTDGSSAVDLTSAQKSCGADHALGA
jgi:hypothetical protein